MSRVSEASTVNAIKYSTNRSRRKLEDLQLKGSNLKRVQKPSDDPVGNMDILSIRSRNIDGKQYLRNASVAKAQLTFTESAIEELTELVTKAKELAIGQASNIFDPSVRKGIAQEVRQLRNQALSIANRRLGNKYIFGGYKTLEKPFDADGKYHGDNNQTKIEVGKDIYVPITFSGENVFYSEPNPTIESNMPELGERARVDIQNQVQQSALPEEQQEQEPIINRDPAASNPFQTEPEEIKGSLFKDLETLENGLLTDNHFMIQSLLPKLDETLDRLIQTRTSIGSTINKVEITEDNIDKNRVENETYRSKIEDADVAELFTDLTRQENVMNASYKASAQLLNNNLMKYIG
ncbi:MAG: flagellar hook-associated protein 3 [Halobacteriovoraceae bacterium]|nr:flagellar hook-associated protein 3 [Halobacteriovoraceae bacterium]|tara:strand:+ start:2006 stop:3058 length:1053 start_codon:yes stop_codon:yes gene_type:complete